MYGDKYALVLANRFNWFHSRSQQVFTVKGKLNLIDYNIHDRVFFRCSSSDDVVITNNLAVV